MARGEEIIFENHIRKIINTKIIGTKKNFTLLDSKNVADIIICRNINIAKIFFIEVKHYSPAKRIGGVGFGDGEGKGFQPEILIKRPVYFENNLIWVFGQVNDDNYYILNNEDSLKYIMGGKIGYKQNNFQRKLFDEIKQLNENEFINWIENWLLK
jgi:hypothetical protein